MQRQQNNNDFQRQMYKGDWQCSKCGTSITELPFEPHQGRTDQLQCRDCFRQSKPSFNNKNSGNSGFQRQMHQGNWKCSKCETSITELPFEPHQNRIGELQCRDCFRQR